MTWTTILVAARVAFDGEELTCSWALLGLDLVRVLRIRMWLQHDMCGETPFICKLWILSSNEKSEVTYFGHFEGPLLCGWSSCWISFCSIARKRVAVTARRRCGGCRELTKWRLWNCCLVICSIWEEVVVFVKRGIDGLKVPAERLPA